MRKNEWNKRLEAQFAAADRRSMKLEEAFKKVAIVPRAELRRLAKKVWRNLDKMAKKEEAIKFEWQMEEMGHIANKLEELAGGKND